MPATAYFPDHLNMMLIPMYIASVVLICRLIWDEFEVRKLIAQRRLSEMDNDIEIGQLKATIAGQQQAGADLVAHNRSLKRVIRGVGGPGLICSCSMPWEEMDQGQPLEFCPEHEGKLRPVACGLPEGDVDWDGEGR